ncbi:MAG: anion permease [Acidaminococcales bacterium]|nr:anion permease [Acidaminococcales bacterium]
MAAAQKSDLLKKFGLVLGPLLLLTVYFSSVPGLSAAGRGALAIALFTAAWWVFMVVPPVLPALFACILFMVSGVAKPVDAFAGFSNPSIWMIVFALVISKSVDASGLGKRVAINIITAGKLTFGRVVAAMIFLCTVAPFFIPSGAAYVALLMALAVSVIDAVGLPKDKRSQLGAAITCFVAVLSLMMGRIPLTGAVANIISIGLVKELANTDITWLEWFANMWPVGPVVLAATYLYCTKVYQPEVNFADPQVKAKLIAKRDALGAMTAKEIRAAGFVSLALVLWVTGAWHGISTNAVGAIVTALLLLPVIGVVGMEDFQKLPWHIFIFAGGSFSIGVVLTKTGVAEWIGNAVSGLEIISTGGFAVKAGFIVLIAFVVHILLETMGEISLLVPIFLKSGLVSAKAVAMLVPYAAGLYLFPYQATPIILSLGFGICNWNDILKYSFFICAVAIIQALVFLTSYWAYTMA